MAITENEIVNTITIILDRLDNLENETKRNKEFMSVLRDRLLELNECVNDILDIISDDDEKLLANKMKQYSKMKALFLKELDTQIFEFDDNEIHQLMDEIIGES
jgi:hypothetical protein|tara:strand:+ start:1061 stop:1372 length:312 start_codon:yes stop_codon:yes gene_type:complete